MGILASGNFKTTNNIQEKHNDRTLAPSYLIPQEFRGKNEVNRTSAQARVLKNQIITNAINAYEKNKKPKAPKFKATSYQWSLVVNLKETSTMQDLEKLADHFQAKYGFQCYQIAIHRDEGYIDENNQPHINHHAHMEFITLNKENGKNMMRKAHLSPRKFADMQTEIAQILGMERGKDKRLSGAKRIEPRKYAQMKEKERKERLKEKELHQVELQSKDSKIHDKDTQITALIRELEQANQTIKRQRTIARKYLSKKQQKEYTEQIRQASKGQGLKKEFFRELNAINKQKHTDESFFAECYKLVERHNIDEESAKLVFKPILELRFLALKLEKEQNRVNLLENDKKRNLSDLNAKESIIQSKEQELQQAREYAKQLAELTTKLQELTAKNTELQQENQTLKAQLQTATEPWIEFGKQEQARVKAHYQACLERERAKELAKEQSKTLHPNEPWLDYDPKAHKGLQLHSNQEKTHENALQSTQNQKPTNDIPTQLKNDLNANTSEIEPNFYEYPTQNSKRRR
ncbi:hypothetical protein [Helicobacter cetorum]|uniref:Mobilization protein n=1 Tax=Helicobacter cetorum (strain ATCC BAA-429 / MIT 00-7128) TaxID=182217 RepID=I0EQ06_HELC0|nr:hypothetical protein [Helicobacter cetorum]AFI05025.1 mobilization protein [Helicobacter cetorum MIT 00-7128]